ncbi:MAG: cyclic nucleotide-binding domain-containing protein [Leptospiraceae bacterium]
MSRSLSLLKESDWQTLRASAQELRFQDNQVIITAGSEQRTIYVIVSGYVRIAAQVDGHSITLHRLGPEETFGEMSFLEQQGASASVVAEGDVRVEAIDSHRLESLLSSDPGFSARVFHSLAVTLSQRLRDATAFVQELNVNEVAQVNRFHSTRLGFITQRQLPDELMQSMAGFDSTLRGLQGRLRAGEAIPDLDEQVGSLCDSVIQDLKRFTGPEVLIEIGYDDLMGYRDTDQLLIGIGAYVFRETFRWFMLSETMAHCYMKPRGFSDDIVTNRLIYGNQARGDTILGESIDRWFLNRTFCRVRRDSISLMSKTMERLLQGEARPAILGLASGSARETLEFLKATAARPITTLVDVDQDALASVAEEVATGISHTIDLVEQNVMALVAGRGRMTLESQNLITVFGLIDYMVESECLALMDWIYDNLKVGGYAIISITQPNVDTPLLVHLLEWLMHERTPEEFKDIVSRSKFASSSQEWIEDGSGVVNYLVLKKDG